MKLLATTLVLAACGGAKTDADYRTDVVNGMHDSITTDLAEIVSAAADLQTAAPVHAWTDGDLAAMEAAWKRTRVAYEHVEGATAPLFGALDISMDERYDGFLSVLGAAGDQDLFDDQGVTGMHGIERILYAHSTRAEVINFEMQLPGYKAAAWPASDAEAMEFKTKLAQRLIDDAKSLHDQWTPNAIDIGAAYQGLVGLMNEQKEKVNLAATGEEESRYANITLFDLRNNLDGTTKIYDLFEPWIETKTGGAEADMAVTAKLDSLGTLYAATSGDALPDVPADWSNDMPTAANLATPFGMLWSAVHADVDPNTMGSVVFEMNDIATLLGFPEFTEQ